MYQEFFRRFLDIKNKLQKPDVPHAVGELVDHAGNPVKNFTVKLLEQDKKQPLICVTDDVGSFQFPNLTWNKRYTLILQLPQGTPLQRSFATTSEKQETNFGKLMLPFAAVTLASVTNPVTTATTTDVLQNRDYYLLIDTSISMTANYPRTAKTSRFDFVREGTLAFADMISTLDNDGITLLTFDADYQVTDHVTQLDQVHAIFDVPPKGMSTVLAKPLRYAFKDYLQKKKQQQTQSNGAYIIVVTDGEAQDGEQVKQYIAEFSCCLDHQLEVGILFLVVGDDPKALAFIETLDVGLKEQYNAKFDIVATGQFTSIHSINETLLAALNPNS